MPMYVNVSDSPKQIQKKLNEVFKVGGYGRVDRLIMLLCTQPGAVITKLMLLEFVDAQLAANATVDGSLGAWRARTDSGPKPKWDLRNRYWGLLDQVREACHARWWWWWWWVHVWAAVHAGLLTSRLQGATPSCTFMITCSLSIERTCAWVFLTAADPRAA